jgi:hypothetical protein
MPLLTRAGTVASLGRVEPLFPSLFKAIAITTALLPLMNRVCFGGHLHTITMTYKAPAGDNRNADDLEVVVKDPNGSAVNVLSAKRTTGGGLDTVTLNYDAFTALPAKGYVYFNGGLVGPNGKTHVTVETNGKNDAIDLKDKDTQFTIGGAANGSVAALDIKPMFTDQPGGRVLVSLDNESGSAVAYTNLVIDTNADASQMTLDNYLTVAQSTGISVPLMVPSSGTLGTGITPLTLYTPSSSPTLFDAGSLQIDGDLLGWGDVNSVPEPSSLAILLCGCGAMLAFVAIRRIYRSRPGHWAVRASGNWASSALCRCRSSFGIPGLIASQRPGLVSGR